MESIDQKAINNKKIEIGSDWEEFLSTSSGKFMISLWDQRISFTCVESLLGREVRGENKHQYKSRSLEDFMLNRGFALGVQSCIDDIKSYINAAKRLLEERREREQEPSADE